MGQNVWMKSGFVRNLIPGDGATTTGAKTGTYKDSPLTTYQATVTGSGSVSATLTIEVSNDGTNWVSTPLGTITLSGTTSATDGFTSNAPWKYHRANISAISIASTVQVYCGV